jgi:feruloyl esterase
MIKRGYAVAHTDGGSTGAAADFVGNNDRKLDFEYRAYPATHDNAIKLIQTYYGKAPNYSYFVGCSEGGREALLFAQRYPTYFNGIQAGAPAKNPSHMWVGNLWAAQLALNSANQLSQAQYTTVSNAAIAACAAPGTGVVADPRKCNWDPSTLLCADPSNSTSGTCLSAAQLATLKAMMGPNGGAKNPRTGKLIFPGWNFLSGVYGMPPVTLAPIATTTASNMQIQGLAGLAYDNMSWDWTKFNLDSDQTALDASAFAQNIDITSPDLSAFAAAGGKLIMWHGWEDTSISPYDTVNYFESVIRKNAVNPGDGQVMDLAYENPEYPSGNTTPAEFLSPRAKALALAAAGAARTRAVAAANQFAQLYMAQGVNHCGNYAAAPVAAKGASSFVENSQYGELTQALEGWVEAGVAPGDVTVTKHQGDTPTGVVVFTTKLCTYPKTLTYTGSGSYLSASNYVCQ